MNISPQLFSLILILLTAISGGMFLFFRSSMIRIGVLFLLLIFILLPVEQSEGPAYFLFLIPILLCTVSLVFVKNVRPVPLPQNPSRFFLFLLYLVSLFMASFFIIFYPVKVSSETVLTPVFSLLLMVILVLFIRFYLEKDKESHS
ncbi:TPA: hypothetical protein DCG86_08710 [Candidatus Marinimicrobia bacterium]|nr:MAG: hypothetical protein XE04_0321 [Marinimicrobia bacterium 46_43]HAE88088.1 hypothetical protein [Candidatus Neomarinimicrobiota bacterium]HBY18432.1 hypothetical protein [Candidatus Neomarinimicrobiota bacterium]